MLLTMNTHFCRNCVFWDRDHGLEIGRLGPIAPCTRRSPSHYLLETMTMSSLNGGDHQSPPGLDQEMGPQLRVPLAVWPYTADTNFCGEFYPCDLDESARRFQHRAAPIV